MPRMSRRGFLGGALIGITASSVTRPASAQDGADGDGSVTDEDDGLPKAYSEVEVQVFCNGEERSIRASPDTSALQAIREQLALTGAKPACGTGVCGACTVLVDGAPRASCVTPATSLQGLTVTTVEGLASGPGVSQLHPVQRAFLAEDAIQCGYCTPGMVTTAAAFHDRWRAAHGNAEPTAEAIAAALEGNLCRCGAYPAITRAVASACRGEHDGRQVSYMRMEGPAKVTGAARFTVDHVAEGMLHGAVLRSAVAHGIVRGIDDSGARATAGVAATTALVSEGAPVRYVGQPLWAVAAETEAAARTAVELVMLEIQPLQALLSDSEAQDPAVPHLYGPREAPLMHDLPGPASKLEGNVRGPVSRSLGVSPGAARRALKNADALQNTVHAGTWRTQSRLHGALEPHAALARFQPSETGATIEVWASTEGCSELAAALADHFELEPENVTVHAEHVGGGFGGKRGLQPEVLAAATLSREARAPVRMVWSPEVEMTTGAVGAAQVAQVSLAVGAEGTLEGLSMGVEHHAGSTVGGATSTLGRQLYDAPKHLTDTDVVTNLPPAKPMRGDGAAAIFALEGAVDQLARDTNQSPIALRRQWEPDLARQRLLDWVDGLEAWQQRNEVATIDPRFRTGIGVAMASWFHRWDADTQVALEASSAGITARIAAVDAGTGTRSLIAATVAQALGVHNTDIGVEIGRSLLPHGPPSGEGLVAASVVPAAEHAVEQLLEVLVDRAEAQGIEGVSTPAGLEKADGTVLRWRELLVDRPPIWVVGRRRRDHHGLRLQPPQSRVRYGRGGPSIVQVSAVRVDTLMGRVHVTEAWVGLAAGRTVVPELVHSQIEGAVVQGIGASLFEARRLHPSTGHVLTHDLEHYRIAGFADTPPIHVHLDAEPVEHVRGGALDIWELAALPGPASIANAVCDAIGTRPRDLPLTPARVLEWLS